MYELRNVTKVYRKGKGTVTALRDVDLSISEGEFLAIQGPTGEGKTTLLQILGALDRPSSGSVAFEGKDLATLGEGKLTRIRSRSFGFVFQTFNLIPTLTAQENVESALVPSGIRGSERRSRARRALDDLGLADRAAHLPLELSGGEQQRVAIARALVGSPRLVLADEPTGNLDPKTSEVIWDLFMRLAAERGLAFIVATHNHELARRADRGYRLVDGRAQPWP
jgi:putative ABC transport system ATP-binding protein